jgi:hypothetical protein
LLLNCETLLLVHFAALIPLVEQEEVGVQRHYSLKNEEDVQSLLHEAVSTKKVIFLAWESETHDLFCMIFHSFFFLLNDG